MLLGIADPSFDDGSKLCRRLLTVFTDHYKCSLRLVA